MRKPPPGCKLTIPGTFIACGEGGNFCSYECQQEAMHKVYVCGTVPWELVPDNGGMIEFYMSKEALSDDMPCSDDCGILECSLLIRDFVQPAAKVQKYLTLDEMLEHEAQREQIVQRIQAAVADVPPEDLLSALTWMAAGLKLKRRAARAQARRAPKP